LERSQPVPRVAPPHSTLNCPLPLSWEFPRKNRPGPPPNSFPLPSTDPPFRFFFNKNLCFFNLHCLHSALGTPPFSISANTRFSHGAHFRTRPSSTRLFSLFPLFSRTGTPVGSPFPQLLFLSFSVLNTHAPSAVKRKHPGTFVDVPGFFPTSAFITSFPCSAPKCQGGFFTSSWLKIQVKHRIFFFTA